MKKTLFSIVFTCILTLNAFAAELKDCSVYGKLNPKYLLCKASNITNDTLNYQNKQWSGIEKEKEKTKD